MEFLFLFYVLPCIVSYKLCKDKNRNPWKGFVVTLILGWFGTLGLWLALKTRRPDGLLA
jgi:hypothetical protein